MKANDYEMELKKQYEQENNLARDPARIDSSFSSYKYKYSMAGRIPTTKIGGALRFQADELQQYIDDNSKQPIKRNLVTACWKWILHGFQNIGKMLYWLPMTRSLTFINVRRSRKRGITERFTEPGRNIFLPDMESRGSGCGNGGFGTDWRALAVERAAPV